VFLRLVSAPVASLSLSIYLSLSISLSIYLSIFLSRLSALSRRERACHLEL